MERMLQFLQENGLMDLSFVIVNSMEPRSKDRIRELQKRVSFEVHQETQEEPVWNLLEGGKDDMYIYDRCGRLAFYIPFPLSIIHKDQPVILSALVTTYFRNPCGDNCSGNSTLSAETETTESYITELTSVFNEGGNETTLRNEMTTTESYDNLDDLFNNTFFTQNVSVTENDTWNENITTDNNNLNPTQDAQNHNTPESKQSLINSLFSFIWPSKSTEAPTTEAPLLHINETLPSNEINQTEENNEIFKSNKSKNACFGAEENVCKDWSKQRLLKARECCNALGKDDTESHHGHCRRFNRRRCKKLQTLLKCCLKTKVSVDEDTTVTNSENQPSM